MLPDLQKGAHVAEKQAFDLRAGWRKLLCSMCDGLPPVPHRLEWKQELVINPLPTTETPKMSGSGNHKTFAWRNWRHAASLSAVPAVNRG